MRKIIHVSFQKLCRDFSSYSLNSARKTIISANKEICSIHEHLSPCVKDKINLHLSPCVGDRAVAHQSCTV